MRLFVGLAVEDSTRHALARAAERLEALGLRGRFVPPENYHVTIAFLGWTDGALVPDIVARLMAAGQAAAPFPMRLDALGAFPNERRPRVAWAGSREGVCAFTYLCTAVRSALAPLGFGFDDRSDAHITLCRCERGSSALPSVKLPTRTLAAETLTLFESRLGGPHARYVPLAAVPLGGASPHL